MSRSVRTDYEALRAAQARAQEADRIGPDQEDVSYNRALATRRLRKCIAEGAHVGDCPRCGL